MRTLIRDARLVVTMDDARRRIPGGYVVVDGETIAEVGAGDPPASINAGRTIHARGKVVLPGLVNTHHHLTQTLTRNVPRVQEASLFTWLGELLLTGCTTTTDHLYLFPRGEERLIDVEIAAARDLGIRFQPTRGSLSRGRSLGGLPPDDVVPNAARPPRRPSPPAQARHPRVPRRLMERTVWP